jgi:hypothetical protein
MDLINIGIRRKDLQVGRLGEIMNFRTGNLFFKAADKRCSQHDIAYGRKADDQKFHQNKSLQEKLRAKIGIQRWQTATEAIVQYNSGPYDRFPQ